MDPIIIVVALVVLIVGTKLRNSNKKKQSTSSADKTKHARAGVKSYIWRSCEDGDVCPECSKNNGKIFYWSRPPKSGHPGEGKCCPNGLCRCYPEAKLK